jgi:hypothetical protein
VPASRVGGRFCGDARIPYPSALSHTAELCCCCVCFFILCVRVPGPCCGFCQRDGRLQQLVVTYVDTIFCHGVMISDDVFVTHRTCAIRTWLPCAWLGKDVCRDEAQVGAKSKKVVPLTPGCCFFFNTLQCCRY